MKHIYLIGASTRMGYQPYLKELLADKAYVDGPAVNCGDSANTIAHLPEWLSGQSPDIVCVTCGLHDLRYNFAEQKYQIPLEDYQYNMGIMLDIVRKQTDAKIFWQSNTPILEDVYNNKPMIPGTQRLFQRFEKDVVAYNDAAAEMATQRGIPIIDLHADMLFLRAAYMIDDGIHWTGEGYQKMAGFVAKALQQHI